MTAMRRAHAHLIAKSFVMRPTGRAFYASVRRQNELLIQRMQKKNQVGPTLSNPGMPPPPSSTPPSSLPRQHQQQPNQSPPYRDWQAKPIPSVITRGIGALFLIYIVGLIALMDQLDTKQTKVKKAAAQQERQRRQRILDEIEKADGAAS